MKNVTTPRQLREGVLIGIGFTPESKPSPWGFVIGLIAGIAIGALL